MNKLSTALVLFVGIVLLLAGVSVNSWLIFLSATIMMALVLPRHRLLVASFFVGFITSLWVWLSYLCQNGMLYDGLNSSLGFATFFFLQLFITLIRSSLARRAIWMVLISVLIWLTYISFDQIFPQKGEVAYLERGNWGITHTTDRNLVIQSQYSYSMIREMLSASAIYDLSGLNEYVYLWIVTPTKPFSAEEIRVIKNWVFNGGSLIVVTDHTDLFGHASVADELLKPFGLRVGKDCVIGEHANDSRFLTLYGAFFGMTANTVSGTALPIICQVGYKERVDYGGRSFFSDNAVSEEDDIGLYCLGLKKRYGMGVVKVFGDSTLFSDFALSRPSAQFCLRMLRDDIATVNVPLFALLFVAVWLMSRYSPRIALIPTVCIMICGALTFVKNNMASKNDLFACDHKKVETSRIYGNWDWVDADGSSLGVPFATCYTLCQRAFPEWHPKPCHKGGVFYKQFDLREMINEVEHIRPSNISDVVSSELSSSISDFISDLIAYSYKHDVWFNNGIGIFREAAYENFWKIANGEVSKQLQIEDIAHKYRGAYYINGVKHDSETILVRNISGGDGFCVIGDWLIGRWVGGEILVKEKWQHHLRFYGDVLFEIEEEL